MITEHKGLDEHDTSACFDRTHRTAINRETAIVAFSAGERLEIQAKIDVNRYSSSFCPRIISPRSLRLLLTSDDLMNKKVGRFKVIGLSKDFKGRWVVRCSCGIFELRSAKAIKNPKNANDACVQCRAVRYIVKRWQELQTGKELSPVS